MGVATLVIGTSLLVAPERAGRLRALDRRAARAFGLADLALVPGLLAGRRLGTWMAAGGALNLVMASYYLVVVRRTDRRGAHIGICVMAALTAADGPVAATLLRAQGP
ncbi:MAG: hypothetical protein H0U79_05975 [Solirubrobacterales bacterium]|nr:hypothetical protein [Solirubrobacterales bacterium]